MFQFIYKAKTSEGEVLTGKLSAENEEELMMLIKRKGLFFVSAKKVTAGQFNFNLSKWIKKVSLVDKMLFTRNLAVMLKSGLSFGRALDILSEQTKSEYFSDILKEVSQDVQKGNSLADSLNKHPKAFNLLFVSMVRVGEAGGNLEEVLSLLALQLKKDHEITSKVKSAMMYPAVIIVAMSIVGVLMMMFVFPSLLNMFAESGAQLPVATQVLVVISKALQNYGFWLFLGVIALIVIFLQIIKTPAGKKTMDGLILKIPIIGGVVVKVNVARFSRTLSSMIMSGVSIVEALRIISTTLGNTYYQESVLDACEKVQKGLNLSEIVGTYDKIYPTMMMHMIEVGEETGSMEDTLKQVAEFYEEEVDHFTSNLSSVIEPVLMMIMGVAVGFFAIALIQPMYSIMDTI